MGIKDPKCSLWGLSTVISLLLLAPRLTSLIRTESWRSGRGLGERWTPRKHIQRIRGDSDIVMGSHPATKHIPSYLKVCAALLDRIDGYPVKHMTITEDNLICSGGLGVTESLTRIFISSWIAAQGRLHYLLDIEYRHSCAQFGGSFVSSLLRENFAENVPHSATERDEAIRFCTVAVDGPDGVNDEVLQEVLSRQTPGIYAEINAILDAARHRKIMPTDGIFATLNKRQPDVVEETAVIDLPCKDQLCTDALILPHYLYLVNLPRSVRSIDIAVPLACTGVYREHAMELVDILRKFNPRTNVQLIEGEASQMAIFARLLEADYIVCGPGRSNCLFPILAEAAHGRGRFRVIDPQLRQFLEGMTVSQGTKYKFANSISPHSCSALQSMPGGFKSVTESQPDLRTCIEVRGRYGKWVHDADFAVKAQYKTPLLHLAGASDRLFREHHSDTFRPPTTYRWQELMYPACEILPITKEDFCATMQRLGFRRLFLLGDSLSLQLGLSLWMLLNPDVDIPLEGESGMKRTIQCPGGYDILLMFVRNDELLENSQQVSLANQVKNCHHFCYPWKQSYMQDPLRTLAIVNVGAHLHSRELFNQALSRFISDFDSLGRTNDVVFFRTLVPGHKNCGRPGLKPFQSFQDYVSDVEGQKVKDTYNWNVFSSYNDAVAKALERRRDSEIPGARMELLDVFDMTVLRPDGHIADEFKVPETRKTDCLHYSLPGPVDWWNHLLFSQLQSI